MSRHSKSNTDGAVFTYHERRNMQHGSVHLRLPAAAHKPWHACALSLHRALNPVLTPRGILYDREAILSHLLRQKRDSRTARQTAAVQSIALADASRRRHIAKKQDDEHSFLTRQGQVHNPHHSDNYNDEKSTKPTPNFWVPGAIARRPDSVLDQPPTKRPRQEKDPKVLSKSSKTVCPVTGESLRSRDLITLHITANVSSPRRRPNRAIPSVSPLRDGHDIADDNSQSIPEGEQFCKDQRPEADAAPYMCPVCRNALDNAAKPIALRTGTVLCARCVVGFVQKDSRDPVSGEEIDMTCDVIVIDNAGTAFAGSTPDDPGSKQATLYRPSAT